MTTTWNAADSGGDIALTGGDLTAASSATYGAVRATTTKASGKWYYEVTVGSPFGYIGDIGVGWDDGTGAVSGWPDCIVGYTIAGWGFGVVGQKWHGPDTASLSSSVYKGMVIQVALDLDAGKIWWGGDGVWFGGGDPASGSGADFTGVSGTLAPMVTLYNPISVTANFGATAFAYAMPAGFLSFDGPPPSPPGAFWTRLSGCTQTFDGAPFLVSIAVTSGDSYVQVGHTMQFTATGIYSDSSEVDITSTAAWGSGDEAIVSVDAAGLATGQGAGTTNIFAMIDGITGSKSIDVPPPA